MAYDVVLNQRLSYFEFFIVTNCENGEIELVADVLVEQQHVVMVVEILVLEEVEVTRFRNLYITS